MSSCSVIKRATASSGPKKAPALSPIPSSPNAGPRSFSSTEDAMRASRGAVRAPAPSRSKNRPPNTPCQVVARHQRFYDGCQNITGQRDRLSPLQPIRKPTRKALHDILCNLGYPFYEADDAAARLQRLRHKNRQDGIEHLRRDVGEEAGKREQERVTREPGEIPPCS